MNGFRAHESQMLGQRRQQAMKDKEEELTLFLEMRRREKERNDLLLNNADEEFDTPLGSKPGTSPIFNIASAAASSRKLASDDFLNADSDKNDYDWLLTPPGTPLFPSLELESQKTIMSQLGTPKARPTALKSRLANPQPEPTARSNLISRQQASSPGLNSSAAAVRRPGSSGGSGLRPVTPTGRPSLTSSSRPSRPATPTSRATLSSTRPALSSTKASLSSAKPSLSSSTRPSLSTTRSTVSSSKPAASASSKPTVPSRSSTPSRSTPRSSTPTSRSSVPPPKPASRASTPTRTPSFISSVPLAKAAAPALKPVSSTAPSRNPVPSRGASPTVKPRPWKPSEMPGFSLEAPPNLRTSLPERPLSATRGRPGAPSSRSSSVEPALPGRPRRQSCSPSRGRLPNGGIHSSGSSVPAMGRHPKISDNVSPGMMGTKMVERVINMRKLMPPKQDDKHSPRSNLSGKSTSSPDSTGFGRTLSKKSLDMAIRHMDIRRSIPGNLRPLMTNIPASSMYSVRSGPARINRTISVSDSPLATSSNASSEVSVNNNGLCMDVLEDHHVGSERDDSSPASARGRRF